MTTKSPPRIARGEPEGSPSSQQQKNKMRTDYTCRNEECECEFEVDFTPATPDRNMHGRWEDAEQGSSAEVYPQECEECGTEVDLEAVEEEFED